MLVIAVAARQRGSQQMFGKNHSRSQTGAVGTVAAFSDSIETIAGSHDPRIRRRTLQIFAKILEDGGMFRRKRGEIVDGLVDSRSQACSSDIVAEDAPIPHVREECRLRNQFAHQVRNVRPTLRRESLLVTRATAESDYHYFSFAGSYNGTSHRSGAEQCAAQRQASGIPQEFAPVPDEVMAQSCLVGFVRSSHLLVGCG